MKKKKPIFAKRLAALRKEKGLTQQQLAEKLGISLAMIKYYETRAAHPNSAFLLKVSEFFGRSIDDLMYEMPEEDSSPNDTVSRKLENLSPEDQKSLLTIADYLASKQSKKDWQKIEKQLFKSL